MKIGRCCIFKNFFSVIFFAFLVLNFSNSLVMAQTPTETDLEKLMNNPNTKVLVQNATYSATPAVTPIPTSTPATSTNRTVLTITSPTEGSIMTDSSIVISGKCSPNTLVNIDIFDDDQSIKYIKHEALSHTLGVTTTDKNGDWIFSLQSKLELG